jgi:hypothetical protein
MASGRKPSKSVDLNAILPKLHDHLNSNRVMQRTEMVRLGLPRAQHQAAIELLASGGFETTAQVVRLPIMQQLRSALRERSQLPVKGLHHLLRGCAAREVASAVDDLVREGTALRVLRTKAEWLVRADADVLSKDEIQTLYRELAAFSRQTKTIATARKRALTIWRDDVRSWLEKLSSLAHASRSAQSPAILVQQRLVQVVREQTIASIGLAFVPAVVEKMQMPLDAMHALLLRQAQNGRLELRPDSGTTRYTEAELRAAPSGPDGSRLLWVRLLEGAL